MPLTLRLRGAKAPVRSTRGAASDVWYSQLIWGHVVEVIRVELQG